MRVVAILTWGVLAFGIAGCALEKAGKSAIERPSVHVRPAAPLRFRGVNSSSADKPGECDSNSPAHWDGDTLYVFNSAGHPWRSAGTNVAHLDGDYVKCEYDTQADGGRWIECTWKSGDGILYGWYHLEPNGVCTASHPNSPHLTAPKIGAVSSSDNGAHWHDLGIVLESLSDVRCDTTNYYFAGGNGDFSVMLDQGEEFLYFFLSSYPPETAEQGVAVARMAWKDRDAPIGKVRKWHSGQWSEPGLGGHVTPMLPVGKDWHRADVDAFCRFVENDDLRLRRQPLADDHLLLVAA